jgi:Tfp pilus assembly protein PilF
MSSATPSTPRASHWNVPYRRNPFFTGRAHELAEVRKALMSRDTKKRVIAIHGLGGIGKTQLALEYAHSHRADYGIVWWIPSEEPATLALSYARLAPELGIRVPDGASLDDIRLGVRRALGERSDWLLVFDNAPGPEDVRSFVPAERTGHVLITTRNPNWGDQATPWPLRPLAREESVTLLRRRTKLTGEDQSVGRLAHALGDLPLALEQAAACIVQTHSTFDDYLRRFETHWAELLRDVRPAGEYPDTVAMTWELSFRQVQESSPDAADLLSLCAFLAPDGIRRDMLIRGADYLPDLMRPVVVDPTALERAISGLSVYSLIDVSEKALSVHRLVSALVRQRLGEDEQRNWASAAVRMLHGLFRFDSHDLATWEICSELLPHVLAAASHGETLQVEPKLTISLLEDAGRYLHKRAQYAEARHTLERAMALATVFYGETHPRVAALANNLGRVLIELGDLAEARACFEKCMEIDRPRFGESDPHIAAVINNYGVSLHQSGETDVARQQFEWALSVYETHYGAEHAKVANVVNNLGYLMHAAGDQAGAKANFIRALSIAESTYGPEHPTVANILINLGIVLRAEGDAETARTYLEKSVQIMRQAHGENHPSVSRAMVQLAAAALDAGDAAAARADLERAVRIDEALYGPDHPVLVDRLRLLGRVLKQLGEVDAAAQCAQRAAAIKASQAPRPQAAKG